MLSHRFEKKFLPCWLLVAAATGCATAGSAWDVASTSASNAFDQTCEALDSISAENIKRGSYRLVGLGPDEQVARSAFAEGDRLFREKDYKAAEKQYGKAAMRWPDSPLEEDAQFMISECQFFADDYSASFDSLNELLKDYPNSRHIDTASKRLFAMGAYWQQKHQADPNWPTTPNVSEDTEPWFDTGGHARQAFQTIIESDSTGPLADDAIMQLANSYFLAGRFNDASDYYKMLRRQYPKSDHQFNAHLLGLQCELKRYQGPQYAVEPLNNAETLIDQLLTQFPSESSAERERLINQRQFVAMQKALRDWETGEYYARHGQNLAARRYYRSILEKYPNTPLANDSQERLAKLQGLPDEEARWAERLKDRVVGILPGRGAPDGAAADPFPAANEFAIPPSQVAQAPPGIAGQSR